MIEYSVRKKKNRGPTLNRGPSHTEAAEASVDARNSILLEQALIRLSDPSRRTSGKWWPSGQA